jgi:hypothetical protein
VTEFDIVIKDGMIVDGTRMPRFRGDVAIKISPPRCPSLQAKTAVSSPVRFSTSPAARALSRSCRSHGVRMTHPPLPMAQNCPQHLSEASL